MTTLLNAAVRIDTNFDDIDAMGDRRATYRRLRQEAPIARGRLNDREVYVVTRHQDVEALLRDPRSKVQPAPDAFPDTLGDGLVADYYRNTLPCIDGDRHQHLRRILAPCLSPAAARRMSGWIAEIIDRHLDNAPRSGVVDFVQMFAHKIPRDVACHLLHVSPEEGERLIPLIHPLFTIVGYSPLTHEMRQAAEDAVRHFYVHFDALVSRSDDLPPDDVVGAIVAAQREGLISSRDASKLLIDVFTASFHTTMVSLTNAIETLADHPEAREQLIDDPSLAPRAWEELLRYEPPGHFRHRFVHERTALSGVALEPGTMILICTASANWDEAEFDDPDRFDLTRPTVKHLAFGGGVHFCLGAHLVRIEGQTFLPRFLRRFPNVSLAGTPPPKLRNLAFPFRPSLPVQLG